MRNLLSVKLSFSFLTAFNIFTLSSEVFVLVWVSLNVSCWDPFSFLNLKVYVFCQTWKFSAIVFSYFFSLTFASPSEIPMTQIYSLKNYNFLKYIVSLLFIFGDFYYSIFIFCDSPPILLFSSYIDIKISLLYISFLIFSFGYFYLLYCFAGSFHFFALFRLSMYFIHFKDFCNYSLKHFFMMATVSF